MYDLYVWFLNNYDYNKKSHEVFNYRFNRRYSKKIYDIEYNKFIGMLDGLYYDTKQNKLVTANGYDFFVYQKDLNQIIKLYLYSMSNALELQKAIIVDFLLTYHDTLKKNARINSEYRKAMKKFFECLRKYHLISAFNNFKPECSAFYLTAINYGIENNLYISQETIAKVLTNASAEIKQKIIKVLLSNKKYYLIIIKYDCEISKNKKYYLDFIELILKQEHGFNDVSDVIKTMLQKKGLSNSDIIKVINLYVEKTNRLCNKCKLKEESFISILSEIEFSRKELLSIVNINSLSDNQKKKLRECIINLLCLKRFLMSDDEYMNAGLHEFSTHTRISNDKIDAFNKSIDENKFRIYGASSLNFNKCAEDAVENYSKYALHSMFSTFSINAKNQTYITNKDYARTLQYEFEKYYENIALEYAKKHSGELMNVKSSGYYIDMLKELSKTFLLQQNITITVLGNERLKKLINDLKDSLYEYKISDYTAIVRNILIIELNINKLLSKKMLKYSIDDTKANLDLLFKEYMSNETARNGIMYLYYSLYEPTGPNLRNKAMHGALIGENLDIPLLVTFSGLILTNWLLSEK